MSEDRPGVVAAEYCGGSPGKTDIMMMSVDINLPSRPVFKGFALLEGEESCGSPCR